jgi:hypothetical protein
MASSRSAEAFELVADARHLGHHGRGVSRPLPLSMPICLLSAVALRLQAFGACLDGLALGFERREARLVEEGLRVAGGSAGAR